MYFTLKLSWGKVLMSLQLVIIVLTSCKRSSIAIEKQMANDHASYSSFLYYPPVDSFDISYITNSISIASCEHPYLSFPSKTTFDYTYDELKKLNDVFIVPDNLEDSVDEDPILFKFESNFANYSSLRKNIFKKTDSLYENNIFEPNIYDPDDHFIEDEYLRTLLNDILEVQIGETIYKILSENWVADFPANNSTDLTFIRGLDISELDNVYIDTMIFDINFTYTGGVYETEIDNSNKRSGCTSGIEWKSDTSGLVHFIGYPQNGCALSWDFGDGNRGTGVIPDHIYKKNGNYLVRLTSSCGLAVCNSSKEVIVTTASISNPCNAPMIADFTIEEPDIGTLKLVSTTKDNNLMYKWENKSNRFVEDGVGFWTYKHNYPTGRVNNFCLTIYSGNGCKSNEKCSTIRISNACCEKGYKKVKESIEVVQDHLMKCKLTRWNGGVFGRNIVAKTVHYEKRYRKFRLKKNTNKSWIRTKTKIYAKFEGDIWIGTRKQGKYPSTYGEPCENKFYISEEEYKGNKSNADCVENPRSPDMNAKLIYTKKKRLMSKHWVLLNGNYYTKELFLTNCD